MKRILVILMALSLAGAASAKDNKAADKKKAPVAQAVQQQESSARYRYLPEEMGNQASFTQAEYLALRFTAYNSRTQRLGASKLVGLALQADARSDSLVISAFVELTEKEKANYLGEGKFNYPAAELAPMLQEGVDFIDKLAALYFAGLDKRSLVINLYVKGALIGSWAGGKLRVLATGK